MTIAAEARASVSESVDLTIVMPCLNEAETLTSCICKARAGIERAGIRGEIVVADNGSTDGSAELAEQFGARLVRVKDKGYGSALRGGIEAARGKWIVMGDADDSYDFSKIEGFVEKLRQGCDLVMGCRLPGGGGRILPGAMPWKNRWIGNPSLSLIGRIFFECPVRDFHCGLRGFNKTSYALMDLKTTGMEFASEMVIKATLKSLRIGEVPITLHPDGRSRAPHLRPWRDGWRHLRFMLLYSPRWLFLAPGLVISMLGSVCGGVLALTPVRVGAIEFNVGTLAVSCMAVIIGSQLVAFAVFTKTFAIAEGLLPGDRRFSALLKVFTLEKAISAGLFLLLTGVALLLHAVWVWKKTGYSTLSYGGNMRRLLPAVTLIILSVQTIWSSFFMSVLGLKTGSRQPPG